MSESAFQMYKNTQSKKNRKRVASNDILPKIKSKKHKKRNNKGGIAIDKESTSEYIKNDNLPKTNKHANKEFASTSESSVGKIDKTSKRAILISVDDKKKKTKVLDVPTSENIVGKIEKPSKRAMLNSAYDIIKKPKISNGYSETDEEIPFLVEPVLNIHDNVIDTFLKKKSTNIDTQAVQLLKWLIYPVKPGDFFDKYWESGPLHITREMPNYYKHVLTTNDIDVMLREHPLYFGRNVDIVTYNDGVRSTENPVGRAKCSIVWDAYAKGHSIRILNPQTYNVKIQTILATLQEYFGTMVGVNVYLTPVGSQGFAPHYDDIEAFIVQLEGRKHWKLYKPKNDCDNLARFSSKDFKREDLGELMSEITLNAGDMLYFPRGVVHEAKTDDEMHSLHITISTYQCNSYIDLLEKIIPDALNRAASDDIEYRKGLPLGYLKHLGFTNAEKNTLERKMIFENVQKLVTNLSNYVAVDDAADQLGRKFIYDAVPPVLNMEEKEFSSKYDGERLLNGQLINRSEVNPDTEVRLLRRYAIRLAIENNEANLYYSTENSKVYHGEDEQFITIDFEMCPIISQLLNTYPNYISVEKLPHEDIGKKISLITELWDYGIIVTKGPLELTEEFDEECDEQKYILIK